MCVKCIKKKQAQNVGYMKINEIVRLMEAVPYYRENFITPGSDRPYKL